ncbi:hypothetical protein [Phenylobacterium sp.]|jgi:hypothetical protein|uniref:hypothetical protein n=1 Tax=Phenylobacterium sp. TaxID=1871053 RepID=UPI002F949CBE
MKLALVLAAGAAAVLSGCAPSSYPPPPPPGAMMPPPPPPPPAGAFLAGGDCFRTSDIRNHTIGDDRTLYLDVQGRGAYRVGMSGACLAGASSSDPLVMRQPPGSPIACRPIDLDISISRSGFRSPCIVESIVRLTPAEVEALPPRLRP